MKRSMLALLGLLAISLITPTLVEADDEKKDYEKAVAAATDAYVKALQAAQKDAAAAGDEKVAVSIKAKIQSVTAKPEVIGQWGWYKGVSTIKSDGTCHWKGANHEEHGVWHKAEGYFFNWGEKNNDWNYLSVGADGFLSGKFIKWGGELKSETKKKGK